MSTCNRPAAPEERESKTCEACGEDFFCGAMGPGCWCEEIHLTSEVRAEIASRYNDCLCRDCLARFAATNK